MFVSKASYRRQRISYCTRGTVWLGGAKASGRSEGVGAFVVEGHVGGGEKGKEKGRGAEVNRIS